MQYVRSLGGSVSKTWNSINPATLSGAIDVIVVEQEDGTLACSPFHVRFGKFSLLRPSEKKVEFCVNETKQDYAMKLGDGGEAFFVFETSDDVPEGLQTSPVLSPVPSPQTLVSADPVVSEPEPLDLSGSASPKQVALPRPTSAHFHHHEAPSFAHDGETNVCPLPRRSASDDLVPTLNLPNNHRPDHHSRAAPATVHRSQSPPQLSVDDAVVRARALSQKLSVSNIPSRVTETGDLMLDIRGYKSSDEDVLHAEIIARKLLSEELEGNYDIGALIGADGEGNLWIYSSEESKEAAARKAQYQPMSLESGISDAASDPGLPADEDEYLPEGVTPMDLHHRSQSESATSPVEPQLTHTLQKASTMMAEQSRNYAKTLRLTSDQLKSLRLRPGANSMSFSVNKATCQAYMHYWKHDVPIVISDIDGTITKSDALGHVLNMIGRDWTHIGVAKLYTEICANGYNILYLTSRSVGQADTTRAYLNGVSQEGNRLPKGPVILSPDRTIAALRREIYLRKPEVFKMACLRDISGLFNHAKTPFYAGFGNRLTDALSYRSVNIPSSRIFTINSNADISLDLLTLNTYKSSYVTMREIVDHFFPPVGLLVAGGNEDFTDFNYWRERPLDLADFSDSESESDDDDIPYVMTTSLLTASDDEASDVSTTEEVSDSRVSEDGVGKSNGRAGMNDTAEMEVHVLGRHPGLEIQPPQSHEQEPTARDEWVPNVPKDGLITSELGQRLVQLDLDDQESRITHA